MPNYRYLGFDERVYPATVIPGEGTLVAKPGDERELDEAPGDGRWVAADPGPAERDVPEPVFTFEPDSAED